MSLETVILFVLIVVVVAVIFYLYQMETMGATKRSMETATNITGLTSASVEWVAKRIDSNSVILLCEITAVPTAAQSQCLATFALPAAAKSFKATDQLMVISKDGQDANGTNVASVNPDAVSLVNQTLSMSFFSNNTTTHTLTFMILLYTA